MRYAGVLVISIFAAAFSQAAAAFPVSAGHPISAPSSTKVEAGYGYEHGDYDSRYRCGYYGCRRDYQWYGYGHEYYPYRSWEYRRTYHPDNYGDRRYGYGRGYGYGNGCYGCSRYDGPGWSDD